SGASGVPRLTNSTPILPAAGRSTVAAGAGAADRASFIATEHRQWRRRAAACEARRPALSHRNAPTPPCAPFAGSPPVSSSRSCAPPRPNDIYLMADQMMPDGKRRGGFARLAAVVKAERAKGRERERVESNIGGSAHQPLV